MAGSVKTTKLVFLCHRKFSVAYQKWPIIAFIAQTYQVAKNKKYSPFSSTFCWTNKANFF